MYAKLTCHPPLGKSTVVPAASECVTFLICLECAVSTSRAWEVAIWHNHKDQHQWEELATQKTTDRASALEVGADRPDSLQRFWFTGTIDGKPKPGSTVSFTCKFRDGPDCPWKWVNDHFHASDGQLLYEIKDQFHDKLSHYFYDISQELKITPESSDVPDTVLWSLTAPVKSSKGEELGKSDYKLGYPKDSNRWFALVRLWSPWLAPRQGRRKYQPDKDAVMSAFLLESGQHVVILAVSGANDVLTIFRHDGGGNVIISSTNDAAENEDLKVIVAVGRSFETAKAATMYCARSHVMKYATPLPKDFEPQSSADEEKETTSWLEHWYDGLTYCTWNGLGQRLTEEKIFKALESLSDNDINITNLIIDDNWQTLDNDGEGQFKRGWIEFEAHKEGFPNGLKHTTSLIRNKYKNIEHIAVWHALFGYWGGISPSGKLAKEYKTREVLKKDGVSGGVMTVIDEPDVMRMYNDFYHFLDLSGIDSVKTDAQFFIDELVSPADRRTLIKSYQDAWNIAHLRHFGATVISCMSQTPQILFHSQLPNNKPQILVRNSDDFFPEVPASHPWHVFCNAHNALLTQHLNALPDWDMFQTSHEFADFHAAARCVSGGPIYITDEPGKHNLDVIHQMTGITPRGDTVIFRPSTIGKSIDPYTSYDEPTLLKISAYVGRAKSGTSILGVFNTTPHALSEIIPLSSLPGVVNEMYIIRAHKSGTVTASAVWSKSHTHVLMSLPSHGWEILSAIPAPHFSLKRSHPSYGSTDIRVANLGLLGKMTGSAAIVTSETHVDRHSGRLKLWTSLKALGRWGVWISDLKNRDVPKDFMVLLFGRAVDEKWASVDGNVLEIDVEGAWKESDQKAGWSNEVALELSIR